MSLDNNSGNYGGGLGNSPYTTGGGIVSEYSTFMSSQKTTSDKARYGAELACVILLVVVTLTYMFFPDSSSSRKALAFFIPLLASMFVASTLIDAFQMSDDGRAWWKQSALWTVGGLAGAGIVAGSVYSSRAQ